MIERYKEVPVRLERRFFDPLEQTVRHVTSVFKPIRWVDDRLAGVTALTLTMDEPLVFESVVSILPLVDEVVVVDAGRNKAKLPMSDKIIHVRAPPGFNTQFKVGLLLSHYHWILRWDADFLVTFETQKLLDKYRDVSDGFCQVKCMVANVDDGIVDMLQNESYLFTFHPDILNTDYSITKKFVDFLHLVYGKRKPFNCHSVLPWFFDMRMEDYVIANHHYKSKPQEQLHNRQKLNEWRDLPVEEKKKYKDYGGFIGWQR